MTNATKSLAGIFVVLLITTIALKWSSGSEASRAFRSNLFQVDINQVSKLVINHPVNPTLTMQKTDEGWQVSKEEGQERYPADSTSINGAINKLNNLSINTVATRDPQKFTRYKVDSTGIKVSLYDGDELLNSIYVGATQRAGRRSLNNYVRLANEDAVYTVEGFLRSTFSKKMEDWRNKRLWDVDQSAISRVDFLFQADSSFSIKKVDSRKWVSASDTLSRSAVNLALSRLSTLTASGFADTISKDAFGNEQYAVQIELSGGEQHRVRFKESPTDTTQYIGITPDSPYVFTFRKSAWDDNVLKARSEFLEN